MVHPVQYDQQRHFAEYDGSRKGARALILKYDGNSNSNSRNTLKILFIRHLIDLNIAVTVTVPVTITVTR